MRQGGTGVCRFYRAVKRTGVAAFDGVEEIGKVQSHFTPLVAAWSRFTLGSQKCLVATVTFDHHIAVFSVKNVSDAGSIFEIGHPGTHLELNHLILFGIVEVGTQYFRRFFIVIPEKFSSHRDDFGRQPHIQSPKAHVSFMHSLIADVTISVIPVPVPVVVDQPLGKIAFLRGPLPQIPIQMGRGLLLIGLVANRSPRTENKSAGHVDIPDHAIAQFLHAFTNGR